MKKSILLVLFGVLILLAGCSVLSKSPGSEEDAGTIVLTFSAGGLLSAKTIEPALDMELATYDVTGEGPDGAYFEQLGVTATSVVQASLKPGEWTITVDGRNGDGVVIGEGIVVVKIEAGKVTNNGELAFRCIERP